MSAKHTPEPWAIGSDRNDGCLHHPGCNNAVIIRGDNHDQFPVALVQGHNNWNANARRIVAAVNACAGIPTEALEAGVVGEMVRILRWAADSTTGSAAINTAAREVLAKTKGESP